MRWWWAVLVVGCADEGAREEADVGGDAGVDAAIEPGQVVCRQPGVEKVLVDGRPVSREQAGPGDTVLVAERWTYGEPSYALVYERDTPGERFRREFVLEDGLIVEVRVTGNHPLTFRVSREGAVETTDVFEDDALQARIIERRDADGWIERVEFDGTVHRKDLLWAGVTQSLEPFTGVDGTLDRVEHWARVGDTLRREGDTGADEVIDDIDELDYVVGGPVTESRSDVDGDGNWDSTVTSEYAADLLVRQTLRFRVIGGDRTVERAMDYDAGGMTVTITEVSVEGHESMETERVDCEPGRPEEADYYDLR